MRSALCGQGRDVRGLAGGLASRHPPPLPTALRLAASGPPWWRSRLAGALRKVVVGVWAAASCEDLLPHHAPRAQPGSLELQKFCRAHRAPRLAPLLASSQSSRAARPLDKTAQLALQPADVGMLVVNITHCSFQLRVLARVVQAVCAAQGLSLFRAGRVKSLSQGNDFVYIVHAACLRNALAF